MHVEVCVRVCVVCAHRCVCAPELGQQEVYLLRLRGLNGAAYCEKEDCGIVAVVVLNERPSQIRIWFL